DGVLKTHTQIPKWLHSAITSRIKIMSKLDISNRKTPQDGGIKLKIGEVQLDLRVSTLPTHLGEKAVIRLLKPGEKAIALAESGISSADLERIRGAISRPQGMLLMTGPTGSGKTTTLHGILTELRSEGTNIITVEDPVEYELEGITQVHVNEKAGLTFANALRSILRQDPDIVMVGEIRDLETADVAFRASNTGHLVLSTLHTNGTAATITRLYDIGVEPYLISSSLHCVVAQRLVRVICRHCAEQYTPDADAFAVLPGIDKTATFMKGRGCSKCNQSGYRGRLAVLEIMEIIPALKKLIAGRASAGELREAARREGMRTLYEAALEHVYSGRTTIDEVLRVISVDDGVGTSCPNCGRTYIETDCPYCGVSADTACSKCKINLDAQWLFCPFCGTAKEKVKAADTEEKAKVLIVDDEFGILKMVELALKPLDLEVHTAQNGREALEKAQGINPSLVITDINMPIMDGYDLIKELRSKVNTMFIPIVILSSRDTVEDKLKGFTFGTDDYITKPFDYTELQARVKRLMKRSGS
ncbi:MAG: Flp pilus assembly complex ATPase component TadA, partial [Nitrospirae bacterium]|nr:Flp pilus assembly complex ATPase component TadA [Nitrospirota bacterium]